MLALVPGWLLALARSEAEEALGAPQSSDAGAIPTARLVRAVVELVRVRIEQSDRRRPALAREALDQLAQGDMQRQQFIVPEPGRDYYREHIARGFTHVNDGHPPTSEA